MNSDLIIREINNLIEKENFQDALQLIYQHTSLQNNVAFNDVYASVLVFFR